MNELRDPRQAQVFRFLRCGYADGVAELAYAFDDDAEQRRQTREQGAHVRAHGWASSRRLAAGEPRSAGDVLLHGGRRLGRSWLWLLSPQGK